MSIQKGVARGEGLKVCVLSGAFRASKNRELKLNDVGFILKIE